MLFELCLVTSGSQNFFGLSDEIRLIIVLIKYLHCLQTTVLALESRGSISKIPKKAKAQVASASE